MASKRRASILQREFVPLIFGNENLTLSLCLPVYNQLERDPGHVSRIITDEDLMLKLLSNFDLYASKIAKFFCLLNKNAVSRARQGVRRKSWVGPGIADELIENVLFPLLNEDFEQFQLGSSFLDLFASIIDFCLPFHPRPLETLAKRLAEKGSLLEALVSGESSSKVMKDWISTFKNTIFDFKVAGVWARRLITQCQCCESSHGVSVQIEIWQKLEDLIGRLTSIIYNYPKKDRSLPLLKNLRPLTDADKKANVTTQMQESGPELPPDIKGALGYFQIPPRNSERALENALKALEIGETLGVLQAVVESFPCRPCYELSTNPPVTRSHEQYDTDYWGTAGSFLFTSLLGRSMGMWRVLVSSQALKDLHDAHFQGDFNRVEFKLIQLASGDWLRNSLCNRIGGETYGTLYVAPYGNGGGILWQTDIDFDEESETTRQLVKIWRIGDLKMISQAVQHILFIHKTYPHRRLEACNQVSLDKATGMNLPAAFGGDFDMGCGTLGPEVTQGQIFSETLFQFNKFYLVTQTTIDNILSGNTRGEYPLVLSSEELEIIKDSKTSTLVLGRSGTGKTTCLVYKLFGRYIVANRLGIGRQKRQVLLTRSGVLSNKLEMYSKRLIATQLNKGEPMTSGGGDPSRLTWQDDREVNDTVFSIKEEDFPLVCTFNYFIKLLENTARAANRKDFSLAGRKYQGSVPEKWDPSMGSRRTWQRLFRRPQVVDFEVFSEEYWPSFPSKLTKNISATLAFMEIIGVIKGSACYSFNFSPLSRDEYRVDGYRISPVAVDRDVLYDIYEYYEKRKRKFDVDDIDRARSILQAVSSNLELKKRIEGAFDEIYVDEIQDQRLLEIMMLLHLVKSPNAIHFAGDTAQSISKDSVFRFQSVKDLLFKRFSLTRITIPQLRGLYKNYRTHQGILSVATSVMRQLYGCFPRLVDRLPDEVGQLSGPKPTMFVGFDATIFSSRMFGATDLHDDTAQFGAEQVIIVRDWDQKKHLKEAIGDFALILTILESKGMEFEDVLLYDFFTTSECIPDFRALANLSSFVNFDGAKHIALCSELKQLYVAITRAQNRLWFFEKDEANLAPMMSIWMAKEPIIEVAHINDSNIQEKLLKLRPGTNANPEVWSAKGYEFIQKKDYENALFCFGRAKDSLGKSLSNAFIAEKKGKALLASGDEGRSEECFRNAIELFHKCGHPLREAACYETLGMFEEAADILSRNNEFGRAGDLYNRIDLFQKAALNYSHARRYNEGASTLARGNLFDDLVHYLNRYAYLLDSTYRLHYSRLCNLLLKRGKISPELKELTIAALQSDSEKEDFFLEYEMTSHLSEFYINRHRYTEACNLAIKDGNLDKAWELNEKYGGIDQLPQQKRIDLFNYAQAKQLLASFATEPEQLFLSDASWSVGCTWLSDNLPILDFWGNLRKIVNEFWERKISYNSITFATTWMKQIFDTIVTFKAHAFISSAKSVSQLPVESISEVLKMAKGMIAHGNIPASLLIFLRIIPAAQEIKSYTIMDSSPLPSEPDLPSPSDLASIVRATTRWTLSQVCRAVDEFHDRALDLYNYADPCTCRRPPGRCRYYHDQITSAEYSALMSDVFAINSLFCHVLPLYHLRFGELAPTGFIETFRPRRRKWLEILLARITYVSSVENEPGIVADARRKVSRINSTHSGVSGELVSLLFYRLKTQRYWEGMCDISSMLEQIQVAETLGVLRSFKWSLLKAYRGSEQGWKSWTALQNIERSLWSGIDGNSVKTLNEVIQAAECNELYSYHTVASLYENMATYLIYKSHPTDFLLPNGWVQMYLRQIPELVIPKEHDTPQNPKGVYREALLSLIQSFCDLIRKMNSDTRFRHKLSGRQRSWGLGSTVFIRRNVDFLATCVLNAFSWQASQGGQGLSNIELHLKYSQTRALVLQVLGLRFAYLPGLLECSSEYSLAETFARSFDSYAGKDNACIIKVSRSTIPFFSFLEPRVPTVLLEDLQPLENSIQKPPTNENTPSGDGEAENYIKTALPAVEAIQRMWRMQYRVIQKRREFFKSPFGQGVLYIQRICKAVIEGVLLERKEKIWRTGVLFSDGLDVYLHVKAIEKLYLEKKKEVKTRIDNAEPSQMESVQYQWERVLAIRDRVSQSAGFLSEPNWNKLDIPGQDLSIMCQEVLAALNGIEIDLRMVDCTEMEVAAAETIQRMWRTCYPTLQKRREFLKTPPGQAISYIRNIYKVVLDGAPLERKDRIQRAVILFREGLDTYEYVKVVENLYLTAKHTIKSRINRDYQIEEVQAQAQWKKVQDIRRQVCRNAGFLSQKNWKELNIPSWELERKFRETLRFLKGIEVDLKDVMANDELYPVEHFLSWS